ncbi:MAG: hypothetical protein LUD47_06085 [Clostridia bacterium]|nr:hypothetical protein [Clostridia bacterium]
MPKKEKLSKYEKLFEKLMKKIFSDLGDSFTAECEDRYGQELEYLGKYDAFDDIMALREVVLYARAEGIEFSFLDGGVSASYLCHILGMTEFNPMDYGIYMETWLNGLYLRPEPLVTIYAESAGTAKLLAKVKELGREGVIDVKPDESVTYLAGVKRKKKKLDFGKYDNQKVFAALTDCHLFPEMGIPEDMCKIFNSFGAKNITDVATAIATYNKAAADGVQISDMPAYERIYGVTECLKDTDSRLIYDEQTMHIMEVTAAFSSGHADKTLRAIKEGNEEQLKRDKDAFTYCCMQDDINLAYAEKIWNILVTEKHVQSKLKSLCEAMAIYRKAYIALYLPDVKQ